MADIPEKSSYYKKERRKFALITYLLTAIFLILALLQWATFRFVYVCIFTLLHPHCTFS